MKNLLMLSLLIVGCGVGVEPVLVKAHHTPKTPPGVPVPVPSDEVEPSDPPPDEVPVDGGEAAAQEPTVEHTTVCVVRPNLHSHHPDSVGHYLTFTVLDYTDGSTKVSCQNNHPASAHSEGPDCKDFGEFTVPSNGFWSFQGLFFGETDVTVTVGQNVKVWHNSSWVMTCEDKD